MPGDFFQHLVDKARDVEPEPTMQPPIDCPRCAALILGEHMARHMDYHERNGDT